MSRLTRAQTLTGGTRNKEYYSDFTRNFAKTPVGNELSRVTNNNSIHQSLKNLILTNLGERLFQPYIGSNVMASLFENTNLENYTELEFFIQNTIDNNEPRVNVIDINVSQGQTEHELLVEIIYNTINNPEQITFTFILKRVR